MARGVNGGVNTRFCSAPVRCLGTLLASATLLRERCSYADGGFSQTRAVIATLTFVAGCAFGGGTGAWAAEALPYDLDGDGRQELVVGLSDASVAVLPGSAERLVGSPRRITEESLGVPEDERGYVFGEALTSGDFDGDGRADLAVESRGGGPRPDGDRSSAAGRVVIVYGSDSEGAPRVRFIEGPSLPEGESYSEFARKLVAGDLNRDGFDDLVVSGQPGEPYFHLVFGGPGGLADSAGRTLARPEGALERGGIFPVVLGTGERVFGETSDKKPMRLVESKTVGDGVATVSRALPTASARSRRRAARWRGRRPCGGRRRCRASCPGCGAARPGGARWP